MWFAYAQRMFVSIIVPTYNEAGNVPELVAQIKAAMGDTPYEVIIADDDSPDRTWEVAENLGAPVRVLRRQNCIRGLAPAVVDGFKIAKGDILGVIDADLQHPPARIPDLVAAVASGADIAVGSRMAPGGSVEGWPNHRKLTSYCATLISKPITSVKDPMAGYFFLKKQVVDGISLSPRGYKILLEILGRCSYDSVVEIGIVFRDRSVGGSKLNWKVQVEYLQQVLTLYGAKLRTNKKK